MFELLPTDLLASWPDLPAAVAAWLGTYLIHSTILLGAAWILIRCVEALRQPRVQDVVWKFAIVGGVVTATLQGMTGLGVGVLPAGAGGPSGGDGAASVATAPKGTEAPVAPRSVGTDLRGDQEVGRREDAACPETAESRASAPNLQGNRSETAGGSDEAGTWAALVSRLADRVPMEGPPPALLVGLWMLGALGMLGHRFGARWWFLRQAGPRRPVDDERVLAMARTAAREVGLSEDRLRRLKVTVSDELAGPVALAPVEVCLPARALVELEDDALHGVLAHECAHLARRDPQWLVAGLLAETLLFIQPLNAVGRKRQQAAAERICDARAAGATDRLAVAESLLCVAEWTAGVGPPVPVAGMADSRSALARRIDAILDADRDPDRPVGVYAAVCAGALLVMACTGPSVEAPAAPEPPASPAAPAAPVAPTAPAAPASPSTLLKTVDPPTPPAAPRTINVSGDSSTMHVKWQTGERSVEVRVRGRVSIRGDASGVASMGDGASLRVRETASGTTRVLRVRSESDGPAYAYRVDGSERSFDEEGRAWMQDILPIVLRATGLSSEARVDYLLESGGAEAVLGELEKIRSDGVFRAYAVDFVSRESVSASDRAAALRVAAESVSSDVEMRGLLEAVGRRPGLGEDAVADAFVEAAETVSSDVEMRTLLSRLVADGAFTPQRDADLRRLVGTVSSDVEARALALAFLKAPDGRVSGETLKAVLHTISSDVEMRSLLTTIAEKGMVSADSLAALVRGAGRTISSDVEARVLVERLAGHEPMTEALFGATLELVETVSSDGEARQAIDALLDHAGESERLVRLLEAARSISADAEMARLLAGRPGLARHESEQVRRAYRKARSTISSDDERRRVPSPATSGQQ